MTLFVAEFCESGPETGDGARARAEGRRRGEWGTWGANLAAATKGSRPGPGAAASGRARSGGKSRGADEACPVCPDRFQRGPSGRGRKGRGSRAWTSGESEARGWEREFLPERDCGQAGRCGSQGLCREGPERRPDCCHPPQPSGRAPRGTLTGFVFPEPGKLFRALRVLSPVLIRPRSPPGNSYRFSEPKPPAPAPLHPHPGVCSDRCSSCPRSGSRSN